MAYMHGIQVIEISGGALISPAVGPVITSLLTDTTLENRVWSLTLAADRAVQFTKRTGADTSLFNLVGDVLSLPAQDFDGGATAMYAISRLPIRTAKRPTSR